MTWICEGEPGLAHVYPDADLVEHGFDEDCICGPTPEPVLREDGSNGWLYTHHSLDNREAREVDA